MALEAYLCIALQVFSAWMRIEAHEAHSPLVIRAAGSQ